MTTEYSTYVLLAIVTLYFLVGTIVQIPSVTTYTAEAHEIESTTITAEVTAYSEKDSCHYENCAMANTEPAHEGAVACPRNIALGTKIELLGRIYTCKDRTAKYLDGRYDVFMGYGEKAHEEALQFGLQELTVTIYE